MSENAFHHYNKNLKNFARANRKEPSPGERKLWKEVLSDGKMLGYHFRRQRAIDKYIVDFFCKELMLVIEIDGMQHDNQVKEDEDRTAELLKLGYETFRIIHYNVMTDIDNVARTIEWKVLEIKRMKGLMPKV